MDTRCAIPPDNSLGRRSSVPANPTSSRSVDTRASSSSGLFDLKATFFATLSQGINRGS